MRPQVLFDGQQIRFNRHVNVFGDHAVIWDDSLSGSDPI